MNTLLYPNKLYIVRNILLCFVLFSFTSYVYPKKIELSKHFIFSGGIDSSGKPSGNGELELIYFFHQLSPLTGKEERLVRKDVLEGEFIQEKVQFAKLQIEKYNSPLWITSASFKGKLKYEFASDMSYIQYTLEEGVFKDSKYKKTVIMPEKPMIIRRTPTETNCITQILSPGFLLTEEFELKEIRNTSYEPNIEQKRMSSLATKLPSPLSYYQADYCKKIVDWVAKSQKTQIYQELSWPFRGITQIGKLWSKTGSTYSSSKYFDRARFTAAKGFYEQYSMPFEGLLGSSEGEYSFSLTNNILTYSNKDQIQVGCLWDSAGKAVRPSDGATESFGCKTGTRNATGLLNLLGRQFKIKYSISCNHKTYQSSFFKVVYSDGTPVNHGRDAHDAAINRSVRPNGTRVRRNDDYAPWRQIHNQSVKFNLDEIARINKISKKELVAHMILTPNWDMPLSKSNYYANWGDIDYKHGINIDHAVFMFFLWKQFGITEDYLKDYIQKKEMQRKDTIYSVVSPYIMAAEHLLAKADSCIHIDEEKGLKCYKQCTEIFSDIYVECRKESLTELVNSILLIEKKYSAAQIYYASKYGQKSMTFNMSECLENLEKYPPKDGLLDYLSECRDNAFANGEYDQVLLIANYLRPRISNINGTENEQVLYDNYNKIICALLKLNKDGEALEIANEYIENTPSSVLPYETLCYIYVYRNDKKSAMEIWKKKLLKSDKNYAKNHPNSIVCNLMKQIKWIK